MDATEFRGLIGRLTSEIAGHPLNAELAALLNERHGPGSPSYSELLAACRAGIADGWMCSRENAGIRYGRVVKPSDETHGFSVDVVDMDNIAGAHHHHPNGEIVLNLALTPGALLDGRSAGWGVNAPGTAHSPTVTQGRALVLYLLPQGAIEFTKAP
ncbi:DUF4863 family protein [Piscinibacter sp.]|jgi:hypothetical protein|uniref:4-hydroxylaminobenzoate lyase n=1 Tax=Piscinibacter sp. TaxID=1903157 RepID=UPI00355A916D